MRGSIRYVTAVIAILLLIGGCDTQTQSPVARSSGPVAVDSPKVRNLFRDTDVWVGGQAEPDALKELRARGVATVIDLRLESQKKDHEEQTAKALDMNYVAVPMASNTLGPEQAKKFLDAMRQRHGGVLIHCASGNRAAGMYGLWLGTDEGLPVDAAIERARKAGLANQELLRAVRDYIGRHSSESMKSDGAKTPP